MDFVNSSRQVPLHACAPTLMRLLCCVAFALWALWRFWKFTIQPILYPDDPKELPYWIPFIGHGFRFFRSADALLAHACLRLGTREPFSITVFGNTLYIVTEPKDTVEVYKNQDTLSFDIFIQHLFTGNGYSKAALQATYADLPTDKPGFPNPRGVSFGVFVQQMNIHQLYAGANLCSLQQNLCVWFSRALDVPSLFPAAVGHSQANPEDSLDLRLGEWCSETVVRVGELAYFGDSLQKVNPNLATDFLEFDDLGWQVLYQYPALLSRKMIRARSNILASMREYLDIPQHERKASGAVWLITAMEDEARALGIKNEDIAVLLFNIYWVNLLHGEPRLIDAFLVETSPAFKGGQLVSPSILWEHSPLLESVWLESLRLSSNAASVRHVDHDTMVGGKRMRKGNRVMIPYRLLHFDTAVYGEDSQSFRPDRFSEKGMRTSGHALTRGPSWRPFGGGKTLCTGRHAAKHATLIFVATFLRRYHVEMVGNPPRPEADLGRPVLGISSWKDGHDFTVRVSPRRL
ncbi:hypothetical protein QQS21_001934 [Conoideocrella luteorostrata]|uniref:Cytochrome P450 n=1 Tax=Conoideocrella luteorostrata TaxID=1105319 RepID=A0AAJ0CW84_9HYPO|nr:hypothetical protein QQS21_001934 [Conoideocrella luteorostrata]